MKKKVPVSILILTYNEEKNIRYALDSVKWASEVFIVDSLSIDKTLAIVKDYKNVKVFKHRFEDFGKQRNWALDNLPFSNKWIFILDADEQFRPALKKEVAAILAKPAKGINGYWCGRRFIFMGKWIKRCGSYPSWTMRLVRLGQAYYEDRAANEYMIVKGKTGYLKNDLIHQDRKGIGAWLAKHNRYSSFEARELHLKKKGGFQGRLLGDVMQRRKFLKGLLYKLPLRPWLRFIYMYFYKLGFLDGHPGFILCLLKAVQDFHINIKLKELRQAGQVNLKEDVKNYWDVQPCGIKYCPYALASKEFFEFTEKRRQGLEPFVKDFAKFNKWSGKRVLEIGCGIGIDTVEFVRSGAKVVSLDISPKSVDLTKERLAHYGLRAKVKIGDAENLDFRDNQFDFVYSWGVLHHTPNIKKAISEILRTLKPGGKFCLMLYNKSSLFALKAYFRYGVFAFRPWQSLDNIFAYHLESPGTQAFKAWQIPKLFSGFANLKIDSVVTPYDVSLSRNLCRPSFFQKFIPKRFGLFLIITGNKPPD